MSFSREVRKSSVAQNRPLYSVSGGADRPYAKKSRASGLHGSSLSLGLDDDGGRAAAAAAAGARPPAAAAGKVHLVNADTLVGMVHELCQQVAVYSDRLVEVERRLDERDFIDSEGGACSPQSRALPGADVEVKLESLAAQLRTAEAAAASKEIQRDLEMRELRSKVTQIELLSSSTFAAPKQPDPFAHVLPTTLYDGKGGVGGGDEPFVPGVPAGAAGFAASPVPSQIATYCKLLQRDVLDTVGEQCRQKKTLAALEKAVEGAEHNLTALRDYVVKVTSLGFPETTSASGFSCDRPAAAAASAAAATATATAAEGGPNLLVSLFQRITDVDHRLALVEADGYVEQPHDASDDAVAAPDPKRADYMRRTGAPGPGHHRGAKFQLSTSPAVSSEQQQRPHAAAATGTGSGRSPSPSLVDLMSDPDVDVASASVPMPAALAPPPQPLRESLSGGDDDVVALARAGSGGSQRAAAQPTHRFAPVKLAGYEEDEDDERALTQAAAPVAAVRRHSGEKAAAAAAAAAAEAAAVQAARDDLRQREEALQRRMAEAEEREGAARRAAAEAERAAAAREAGAKRAADELQERRRRLEEDEQQAEVRAALARRREVEAEAEAAASAAAAAAEAREVEQRRAAAAAEAEAEAAAAAAAAAAEAAAEVDRAASSESAKPVEVEGEDQPREEEEQETQEDPLAALLSKLRKKHQPHQPSEQPALPASSSEAAVKPAAKQRRAIADSDSDDDELPGIDSPQSRQKPTSALPKVAAQTKAESDMAAALGLEGGDDGGDDGAASDDSSLTLDS